MANPNCCVCGGRGVTRLWTKHPRDCYLCSANYKRKGICNSCGKERKLNDYVDICLKCWEKDY